MPNGVIIWSVVSRCIVHSRRPTLSSFAVPLLCAEAVSELDETILGDFQNYGRQNMHGLVMDRAITYVDI